MWDQKNSGCSMVTIVKDSWTLHGPYLAQIFNCACSS